MHSTNSEISAVPINQSQIQVKFNLKTADNCDRFQFSEDLKTNKKIMLPRNHTRNMPLNPLLL